MNDKKTIGYLTSLLILAGENKALFEQLDIEKMSRAIILVVKQYQLSLEVNPELDSKDFKTMEKLITELGDKVSQGLE